MSILILLGLVLVVLAWVANRDESGETGASDRMKHRHDDDSHIYYYNNAGELVHESETCRGCMTNYAEKLKKKGVKVDEVILGRRNSGDLEW